MSSRVAKAVIVTRLPYVHLIIVAGRAAPGTPNYSRSVHDGRLEARPPVLDSPRLSDGVKGASRRYAMAYGHP
jgi:hypothetical protein